MDLLIISNMYPSTKDPVYGTFVQSFVDNISLLNKKDITEIVVIKGRDGHKVHKIWKYIKFYVTIIFRLLFNKYDIIYVHTITYPIIPIRIVSYFKDLPLVFNVHGGDVLTRGNMAAKLKDFSKPLLKRSKLIVSPSHYFKDILLRDFPFLQEEKIYVSPSGGIDNSFFKHKPKGENEVLTIGYVSRIDEAKGWDTFLCALRMLLDKNEKFRAIIAGRGAQSNEMINMINALSLNDCVEYVGPIPYRNLPDLYSSLDLFVFPTCLEESLGLVGLEAMACGVPVIGSRIGGLQDYIIEGFNGYYFTPGDACDLSNKIKDYIKLEETKIDELQNNAINTAWQYKADVVNMNLYKKIDTL